MNVKLYIVLVMSIILLVWVIFCGIQFVRQSKRIVAESDFTAHVKCENCNYEYDVNAENFNRISTAKYVKKTNPQFIKGMVVKIPQYSYYARKFQCPNCNKKAYGNVLNINEIHQISRKPVTIHSLKWLFMMFIGGAVILILTSFPMRIADEYTKKQVEDMKQDHYEEVKDKYY